MTDRELLYTGLKEFLPEVSEKMIDDLLKFSALLLEKNKVMNLTAVDRKSTRLNSSHTDSSRMPSSA